VQGIKALDFVLFSELVRPCPALYKVSVRRPESFVHRCFPVPAERTEDFHPKLSPTGALKNQSSTPTHCFDLKFPQISAVSICSGDLTAINNSVDINSFLFNFIQNVIASIEQTLPICFQRQNWIVFVWA